MKTLLKIALVAALAYGGWRLYLYWQDRLASNAAAERVRLMLKNKGSGDEQTALCLWATGDFIINLDDMEMYLPLWQGFWHEAALDPPSSWEIVGAEAEAPGSDAQRVTLQSGSARVVLRVPLKHPMAVVGRGVVPTPTTPSPGGR